MNTYFSGHERAKNDGEDGIDKLLTYHLDPSLLTSATNTLVESKNGELQHASAREREMVRRLTPTSSHAFMIEMVFRST